MILYKKIRILPKVPSATELVFSLITPHITQWLLLSCKDIYMDKPPIPFHPHLEVCPALLRT